jgi:hypothetical protein
MVENHLTDIDPTETDLKPLSEEESQAAMIEQLYQHGSSKATS